MFGKRVKTAETARLNICRMFGANQQNFVQS